MEPRTLPDGTTLRITAQDLRTNSELLKEYQQWRDSSMTKLVTSIVNRERKPEVLNPSELAIPNIAAALYFVNYGEHWVLDRMLNLDREPEARPEIEPTYAPPETENAEE